MRYAMLSVACVALGAACASGADGERPLSPADVVALAAADVVLLDPAAAKYVRYLSLHNLPEAERPLAAQVLGGFVNCLSREPDLVRPTPVAGGLLLRINTEDYGATFGRAWERLADVEPYFHATVTRTSDEYEEVDVEVGFWVRPGFPDRPGGAQQHPDEVWRPTGTLKERRRKKAKTTGLAPWLTRAEKDKAALEALVGRTQSAVPVVAAEWFVFQTAIQADRGKAGYYDFLGIKNERTFQQLVGFVEKGVDPSFLVELKESVAVSGVTLQPRAMERKEKVAGALWRTKDVRLAKDRGNPLRVLDEKLLFDATEQYGHLSNGLWATFLGNNKGERQDSAPDFIASDSTAPHNDRRVHIFLSCVRCHTDSGLQDIDGWVRGVLNSPPNFLAAEDYREAKRLRQQYVRRLEPFLAADRKRYAEALLEASGLTPEKFAGGLGRMWQAYAEDPVTADRAARDLGVTTAALQKALADQGANVDPILSAFRLPKPRPIPVTSWHETYPLAQLAVGGYALTGPKK